MGIAAGFCPEMASVLQRFLISWGKLGNRCKFLLGNASGAAVILDFRAKLENRCKVFPVYTIFRASILDFRARFGNRCKECPCFGPGAAVILDLSG